MSFSQLSHYWLGFHAKICKFSYEQRLSRPEKPRKCSLYVTSGVCLGTRHRVGQARQENQEFRAVSSPLLAKRSLDPLKHPRVLPVYPNNAEKQKERWNVLKCKRSPSLPWMPGHQYRLGRVRARADVQSSLTDSLVQLMAWGFEVLICHLPGVQTLGTKAQDTQEAGAPCRPTALSKGSSWTWKSALGRFLAFTADQTREDTTIVHSGFTRVFSTSDLVDTM